MLRDPYPVPVWTAPCCGSVKVPGSKSLTNRALVLAALCDGPVRLEGALFSRDSKLLVDNLRALGFEVRMDASNENVDIRGLAGRIPVAEADLFVGNAGTVARFLTAFLCLHPQGTFHLDGDQEMRNRPMAGLLDALQGLGAEITCHDQPGCFPFTIRTKGLPGGRWGVDASASSQMLSAMMMVAPFASGEVHLRASGARPAFVNMTAALMRQFGAVINGTPEDGFNISNQRPYRIDTRIFQIEPDATAASYFLTLPLVAGGSLTIEGLRAGMLQGDMEFTRVLEAVGLQVDILPEGCRSSFTGQLLARPGTFDFECFSDTFLTLAAVAPLLPFPVTIRGIGHTRHQETDRIHAMTTELRRTGAAVEEGKDRLRIHPFPVPSGTNTEPVVVQTYRDHRVAMSLAILGCRDLRGKGEPWLAVADPSCCGKTFPGFFEVLDNLYRKCHDE
jgi:3-phosphoshikimate 1-carboxyvinyltransferase